MSGETFGAMLKRLRIERGMSQNELARSSGVDPAYVNRLERAGEQLASGKTIKQHLPGREIMLGLAESLDLSYAERDRLLFIAGLAPEIDWQARCEDAEAVIHTIRGAVGEAVGVLNGAVEPTMIRSRAV